MRISESKIAEVAAAADIVQVISAYVDLKKSGKDYRGLCPFHGDKSPSFYVSPQKGIFHCFGCGSGGSVFNFIMKLENTTFVEAIRILAQRYGIPLDFTAAQQATRDEKQGLVEALQAAARYYVDSLGRHDPARDYLRGRGLSDDWTRRLGLGFAPDMWEGVREHLHREKVDVRAAVAAGLIRPRNEGGGHYDYFRSRVMIPIHDLNGGMIAFGGRILGQGEPKYLNSPESVLFRKKSILYGLDSAREAIRREGFVAMVEGYFDQISLRIRGLENTVAPLGTALGSEQIKLLKRFCDSITVVFDGDEAGLHAVKRSIPLFLAEGVEPRCVILKEHKDPDEAINKLGVDGFRRVLDQASPIIDFFFDDIQVRYDLSSLRGRDLALQECLPVLRELADSKNRDYLIERCSSRIRVREDRVRKMLGSGRSTRESTSGAQTTGRKSFFDFPADERNVVRGMLIREGFIDRVLDSGLLKHFQDETLNGLARRIIRFSEETGGNDPFGFCRSLEDPHLAAIVAGWLQPKPEEDDLRPEVDGDKTIDESLDSLRMRELESRKSEIQHKMNQNPPEEEFNLLARELLAIGQRLRK